MWLNVTPYRKKPVEIKAAPTKLAARIGCDIDAATMKAILENLDFTVEEKGEDSWVVTVPTWRKDCDCSADLSEEVARMYGYDKIESRRRNSLWPVAVRPPLKM